MDCARESAVRHFAQGNSESFGHALQERAVARGALRVQAEIGHRAVFQDHDLDVDAADVADAIGIGEVVQAGAGVSDGFDHAAIRAQNAFQQILSVAGDCEAENLSVADRFANLPEQTLGVVDGIALAERVAGEQQFFIRATGRRLSPWSSRNRSRSRTRSSFFFSDMGRIRSRTFALAAFACDIYAGGGIHLGIQVDEFAQNVSSLSLRPPRPCFFFSSCWPSSIHHCSFYVPW